MNTVSFVQFSSSWLQNAWGKFVLQAEIIKGCGFARIKIMMVITKHYPSIGNHSHSEQCIGKQGVCNGSSQWVTYFYMSFLAWILGMVREDNMMCTLTWIGITLHLPHTYKIQKDCCTRSSWKQSLKQQIQCFSLQNSFSLVSMSEILMFLRSEFKYLHLCLWVTVQDSSLLKIEVKIN